MAPLDPQSLILEALSSGKFYLASGLTLRLKSATEETVRWEVLLGHLLDPLLSRQSVRMQCWHLYVDERGEPSAAPLISVYLECSQPRLHVVRRILTHAFEGYEDAPGVFLSRPTEKWLAELVGSLALETTTQDQAGQELGTLILLAVVGTSRLPITSLECPLPLFSLGMLAYLPLLNSGSQAIHSPLEWLSAGIERRTSPTLIARALETVLRAKPTPDLAAVCAVLEKAPQGTQNKSDWTRQVLQHVFNSAALSPYTGFADAVVALVESLASGSWFGVPCALATYSYMLRHLVRHLTAFDLTLFHNFGANFPDALFLDALLRAYLRLLDQQPRLAESSALIRRALRQGCLVRYQYEGHRVPDAPTSLGENTRILPAPFTRVPEEQITDTAKRRRKLFDEEPTDSLLNGTTRNLLRLSLTDLDEARELQELGTATYLDRPLGILKAAGEVDQTPLLACVAYSRFVAARRLAALKTAGWIDRARHDALRELLPVASSRGFVASELNTPERPGVVSLADANKAASDIVLLHTTRSSLNALLGHYQLSALAERFPATFRWITVESDVLLVADAPAQGIPRLRFFAGKEQRLELGFPSARSTMAHYRQQAGSELPERLLVLRAADDQGQLIDVEPETLWLALHDFQAR